MSLTGLDVSKYQDTTPPLTNYAFLFARATYGLKKNERYDLHTSNAAKAGLVVGAYHFGYNSTVASPEAQAQRFLAVAGDADLLALDLESSGATMTVAEAKRFIAEVHRLGRRIGLYHSESNYPACGQDWDWIASWDRDTFPFGAEFWQYRGSPLDLDKFRGDMAALKALVASSHIASEATVGLSLTLTTAVTGILSIKAGVDAIRVSDGVHYKVPIAVDRAAVPCAIAGGGSAGFLVDLNGDEFHFIRGSEAVTFAQNVLVDASPFTQADIDAAVRLATEGLFTKAEVDALIQADRAKARPVLTVTYE